MNYASCMLSIITIILELCYMPYRFFKYAKSDTISTATLHARGELMPH